MIFKHTHTTYAFISHSPQRRWNEHKTNSHTLNWATNNNIKENKEQQQQQQSEWQTIGIWIEKEMRYIV